jgi:hypothetical protein
MPDTHSRHVIQYVIDLDEGDLEAKIRAKVSGAAQRAGGGRGMGGSSAAPGAPTAQVRTSQEKTEVTEEAKTIGEAIAEKLNRLFGPGAGGIVTNTAYQHLNRVPGLGQAMGIAMPQIPVPLAGGGPGAIAARAAGAETMSAGLGAAASAAIPVAAALAGLAFAATAAYGAISNFKQGVGQATSAIIGGNATSMLQAGLSLGKSFAWLATLTTEGVALPLVVFGYALDKVNSVMAEMVASLGQYNASIIGQMRVADLMNRMLKIQMADLFRPAMEQYVLLLQDVMRYMSGMPEVMQFFNQLLTGAVATLRDLASVTFRVIKAFEALYHALWAAVLASNFQFSEAGAESAKAMGAWKEAEHPDKAGGDLKLRALQFNRAFMDAMGRGGTTPAHVGGRSQKEISYLAPTANPIDVNNIVTVNAEFKLAHEVAVREAVERLRDRMMASMKAGRDEARMMSLSLDGTWPGAMG